MSAGAPVSRARTRARRLAMQGLYQWQIGGHSPSEIYSQLVESDEFDRVDAGYFRELLFETIDSHLRLQESIAPYLDRTPERLDPMERAILLIAAYELTHRDDVPYRVVINEAIELAKRFGAEGGHKYVNGVLDRAASHLRAKDSQPPK